jgi:hypothetical protein
MNQKFCCYISGSELRFDFYDEEFISRFVEPKNIYIGDYDFVRRNRDETLVGVAFGKGFLFGDEAVEKIYNLVLSRCISISHWDGYYDCLCVEGLDDECIHVEVRQIVGSRVYIRDIESILIELPVVDEEITKLRCCSK